jgi:transposase InsO family protein
MCFPQTSSLRLKPPRRRAMAKLREDRTAAVAPNQVWAMDWIYGQLFEGRRIWVLTMVDTFSCVCPALRVCRVASSAGAVAAEREAEELRRRPAKHLELGLSSAMQVLLARRQSSRRRSTGTGGPLGDLIDCARVQATIIRGGIASCGFRAGSR